MNFQYIKNTTKLLESFLEKYGGKVVSCTQEEIDKLESMLPDSYKLPAAYKEFLLYGGKEIGQFYEPGSKFDYKRALDYVISGRSAAISLLKQYEDNPKLPDDVYILTTYMSSYFNFFKLTEGENPPVYEWLEEDEIGTEAIVKAHDSFTDFIREEVRIRNLLLVFYQTKEKLDAGNPPRDRQFWIAQPEEELKGITGEDLARHFGVDPLWRVEEITETLNISPIKYLEELSGWKAIKVNDEIRFFPLSYESPEEKEKKASLLQNKIEEKKQELAKVEKRIANYQARIKNLSGGVLTGGINFFDNPSRLRIKELEKDLIKQKVVKQNLEREIAKLEENRN